MTDIILSIIIPLSFILVLLLIRIFIRKSFIFNLFSSLFRILKWLTPLKYILLIFHIPEDQKDKNWGFVDSWASLPVSIPILLLFTNVNFLHSLKLGLLIFAIFRIYEILVVNINVILFDEHRRWMKLQESRVLQLQRSVILVSLNYIEIVFWYALSYRNIPNIFVNSPQHINTYFYPLQTSFASMTNFVEPLLKPLNACGQYLLFSQSVIGFLMIILVLAYFISHIPKRESIHS